MRPKVLLDLGQVGLGIVESRTNRMYVTAEPTTTSANPLVFVVATYPPHRSTDSKGVLYRIKKRR